MAANYCSEKIREMNDRFHGPLNRGTRGFFPTPKRKPLRVLTPHEIKLQLNR